MTKQMPNACSKSWLLLERETKLNMRLSREKDRHEQTMFLSLKTTAATLQEKLLWSAVIRKQFELEDLEGQSEDVAGHMEQACRQMRSGFVTGQKQNPTTLGRQIE